MLLRQIFIFPMVNGRICKIYDILSNLHYATPDKKWFRSHHNCVTLRQKTLSSKYYILRWPTFSPGLLAVTSFLLENALNENIIHIKWNILGERDWGKAGSYESDIKTSNLRWLFVIITLTRYSICAQTLSRSDGWRREN